MKLKFIAVIGNHSDWASWRKDHYEPKLDIHDVEKCTLTSGSTKYIWIGSKGMASTCEFVAMIFATKDYKSDEWQKVISYVRGRIRQ